ncbi:MAG TPA: ScyD/ScyE family protein [Chloroflexota bacterium]|nr:ScyD/ScyE family protein [Chloroflexota bacterium]
MNLKKGALRLLPVVGTICLLGASLPMATAHAAPSYQVIASGLDNPRGLAFDSMGQLYVAEGGKGGTGPCVESPEGDGKSCFGPTGAITRIFHGQQERIVTGLPSIAGEDGSASGPVDVAVVHPGLMNVVIGLGGNTDLRDTLGTEANKLGHLVQISKEHPGLNATVDWKNAVDLAAYERDQNPDGGENDTNPYALTLDRFGNAIVADAGGNDLLKVDVWGNVSTIATFPDRMVAAPAFLGMPAGSKIPMQAVPTAVARGLHGEYYVAELTGFPFPAGAAQVYLVNGSGHPKPQVIAGGFTNIIDLAVGKDGSLYVLEIAKDGLMAAGENGPTGALIKIAPNGQQTTLMTDGLVAPGGLAIGPDNNLYVSNYSVSAGQGEVIRILQ